jgi:hypothetical protein
VKRKFRVDTGYWLLVIGYWLLCYWLLCYWLLEYWLPDFRSSAIKESPIDRFDFRDSNLESSNDEGGGVNDNDTAEAAMVSSLLSNF